MPVRPEDSSKRVHAAVLYATLASVAMMGQQVAGRATSTTLFLSHFPIEYLPKAMAASAALSAAGVFGFARVLTRMGPARGVPFVFGLSATLFMGEWALSGPFPRAMAIAVYAHTALFGATVTSAFWSLVNERFDPHTAKRVVSRITSGTTIGGVVGGLVTWRIGQAADVATVPLGLGILNFIAMALTVRMTPAAKPGDAPRSEPSVDTTRSAGVSPLAILASVRRTPYLRTLAALVALGALVQSLLDFVLNADAVATFGRGEALLTFFALFYTVTGLVSFVVQSTITRRALENFGLAGTISALPLIVVAASLSRLFLPQLWAATLVRGAESTARGSLYRAGYELLYAPLPQDEKRATKTVIDVGFDRLGSALGAGLTGLVLMLPVTMTGRTLIGLTVLFSLVTFGVSRTLHVGYVRALERNLRSGVLRLDKQDARDAADGAVGTVTEALDALDRKHVLRSLLAEVESLRGGRMAPMPSSSAFLPPDEPSAVALNRGSMPPSAPSVVPAFASSAPSMPSLTDTPPPITMRVFEAPGGPVMQAIADVRSGTRARVASGLARADVNEAMLVSHAVELLTRDGVSPDVMAFLRSRVDRIAGQLVDLMLDETLPAKLRRQLPRILASGKTSRALEGLLAAQDDGDFDLRFRASVGAARLTARIPELMVPRDTVIRLVLREAARVREEGVLPPARDTKHERERVGTHRSRHRSNDLADTSKRGRIELLFTLLSLTMEREPLRLAFLSLVTNDGYLRGTALEYLGAVLDDEVVEVLFPILGVAEPSIPSTRRSERELTEQLKESRHSLWTLVPPSDRALNGEDDDDSSGLL